MKRKIPVRNYLILVIICIVTISITVVLLLSYNKETKIKKEDYFREINLVELDSYILDNPNTLIYVSNISSEDNNDLHAYILQKELQDDIVYINVLENTEGFNNYVAQNYYDKNKKIETDNFNLSMMVIESGKIVDIIISTESKLNLNDVETLLLKYGYIEND
ncbi:MAG TPA: hypothetical protein GX747_04460 [Tenericutes bacterium]|nr:hypothetical protein [Mycoplasmatota bacterium]